MWEISLDKEGRKWKEKNYKKVSLWKLKKMLTEKREQKLSR